MTRRRRSTPVRSDTSRDSWLVRRRRVVFSLLVAAAFATRVTFFLQLNATPFIEMQRWRESDMNYYDTWARQIAGGDWLSASVRVPMHQWHRDVAAQYFSNHPETRSQLQGVDADESIWARWMRLPQFYQDPLYAYVIALTYRVAGADVRYVYVWQLALGVLCIALIWHVTRLCFGDVVAAVAGTIAVLCGPLIFYELLLLRETAVTVAGLALVALVHRVWRTPGIAWFGALGLALGLCCLLKSTFVLSAVIIPIALLVGLRGRCRELAELAAATTAGLALAIAPLVARNVAVGASPLALAASGPLTFVASNNAGYTPDAGFVVDASLMARFLGDTNGGWLAAGAIALERQTVANYASLLWRKWDRVWHWYEIPNNENFYYIRTQVPVLAWLPVTFWGIGPLALVGLALSVPRLRESWTLYTLAALSAVPLIMFYVLARFRIALVAAVIPFAAFALVDTVRRIRARQYRWSVLVIASLGTLGFWTGRPLANGQPLIRTADWILAWSVSYGETVHTALEAEQWDRAGSLCREFFQKYEPDAGHIAASGDATLGPQLATMHGDCARVLIADRRWPEAIEQYRALLALQPRDGAALNGVGIALANTGKLDEAIDAFRRAVDVDPRNSHAHYNLARALAAHGDLTEAVAQAQRAAELSPADPVPRDLLRQLGR